MRKPIIYVVGGIFYYDTTSFACLLHCEVLVPAKGVEALEFLFREVWLCGWYGEGRKGHFSETDVLLECRIGGYKGGIQSGLPWNGCLGGNGLFLKKCLILRDLENLSKSYSRFFMFGVLGVGMKLRPLLRTRSEIWSRGWLLNV